MQENLPFMDTENFASLAVLIYYSLQEYISFDNNTGTRNAAHLNIFQYRQGMVDSADQKYALHSTLYKL